MVISLTYIKFPTDLTQHLVVEIAILTFWLLLFRILLSKSHFSQESENPHPIQKSKTNDKDSKSKAGLEKESKTKVAEKEQKFKKDKIGTKLCY